MSRSNAPAPTRFFVCVIILAVLALILAVKNQSDVVISIEFSRNTVGKASQPDDISVDNTILEPDEDAGTSSVAQLAKPSSRDQQFIAKANDMDDIDDAPSQAHKSIAEGTDRILVEKHDIFQDSMVQRTFLTTIMPELPKEDDVFEASDIEDLEETDERTNRDHSQVHVAPDLFPARNILKDSLGCKATGPKPARFHKRKGEAKPCGARIVFLFLVMETIYHIRIWKTFFDQAPRGAYQAFVHCKKECAKEAMFKVLPFLQQVPKKPSSRCLDLVTAEASLVKHALKSYVTGADVLQKYVFLTDSSLPIKPFSVVYDTLTEHRESDFCFFRDDWWPKTFLEYVKLSPTRIMLQRGGAKPSLLVKHSQFAVLNRGDAEIFAKNWIPVNRTTPASFKVPLKADRWTKGMRFVTPPMVPSFAFNFHKNRKIPFMGMCADEFALFSTLYGTFEKNEFGEKRCPLNYSTSCKTIEKLLAQRRCRTLSIAGRFNDLINEIRDDAGSHLDFGSGGHPCTFLSLSQKSLRRLRWSSFLFARKFVANASLTNYSTVVFS